MSYFPPFSFSVFILFFFFFGRPISFFRNTLASTNQREFLLQNLKRPNICSLNLKKEFKIIIVHIHNSLNIYLQFNFIRVTSRSEKYVFYKMNYRVKQNEYSNSNIILFINVFSFIFNFLQGNTGSIFYSFFVIT